jgi:hypothetical protein
MGDAVRHTMVAITTTVTGLSVLCEVRGLREQTFFAILQLKEHAVTMWQGPRLKKQLSIEHSTQCRKIK